MTKFLNTRLPTIVHALTCYLGVGVLATAVHQLVFFLMLLLEQPMLGSISGAALGAVTSFLLSRRTCFATSEGRHLQPRKFVCVILLHNLCNAVAMGVFLYYADLPPVLAQILVTACLTLVVFFIHHHWTYSHVDLPVSRCGR